MLYARIYCIENIKFPLYLKMQHQQGLAGQTYEIRCRSYAEVDFYRSLCKTMPEFLDFIGAVDKDLEKQYYQLVDGGPTPKSIYGTREEIDGKSTSDELPIRNVYQAEPLSEVQDG